MEGLEPVPIEDAEVYYLRHLPLARPADAVLGHLIEAIPWRNEKITVWGKTFLQPRLTSWHGEAGMDYAYSGIRLVPLPWTPVLLDIKRRAEAAAGETFNSVLLNYYRDHRDSVGFHSDDEPELGNRPVIASLSLGEERTFILKHKIRRELQPVRLKLASGSLLVMKGETQRHWRHAINKQTPPCGPRVNLTFRRIRM